MSTKETEAPARSLLQYSEEIQAVCAANGVSADLVRRLLGLEERYPNLHSWGARPRLRREIAQLLEESLRTRLDT